MTIIGGGRIDGVGIDGAWGCGRSGRSGRCGRSESSEGLYVDGLVHFAGQVNMAQLLITKSSVRRRERIRGRRPTSTTARMVFPFNWRGNPKRVTLVTSH